MYVLEWKSKALVEENFQPQHAHVTMAEGNNSLNTPPKHKERFFTVSMFDSQLSSLG